MLRLILASVVITLVTLTVYFPAFDNGFVNWDDQVYVEENSLVINKEYGRLWKTPVSLNYHPLTMISLAMQTPGKGKVPKAAPFIRANIMIHIVNSMLVFLLIWMITGRQFWVAVFTAGVFAWHPAHVESVAWVSERKDVLYTFFLLLSLISYWQYLDKKASKWLIAAGLLFVASVLSKAMAVVIPLMWMLLDYWHGRTWHSRRALLEKVLFLAISLFFGLMAVNVQSGGDFGGLLTLHGEKVKAVAEAHVMTSWQRIQVASYGFVNYVITFFKPDKLSALYPYPPAAWFGSVAGMLFPLVFPAVAVAIAWSSKKTRIWVFGAGFFFISLVLVLQFLSVGIASMADRYTYVPYIGLAFGLAASINALTDSAMYKKLAVGAGVVFLLFLAFLTRIQSDIWQDPEKLWTQVLNRYPTEDTALANRGNNRGKTGNIQGAMEDFVKAIADGCDRADVYEGLGNCYGTLSVQVPNKKAEYIAKAISMYKEAIRLEPNKGGTYYNLGVAQLQSDPGASADAFATALSLMPHKQTEILRALGEAQINAARYDAAAETLTKVISAENPSDILFYNRGLAHLGRGDKAAATADFSEALRLNPNNADARMRLESMK